VVGGLAFSQIITLYITPVIYTYLDALQQRFGRGAHARKAAQGELAPEPVRAV
jgi:HAE1 family hydrophobic/amphiphilic exporter-1